MQQLADELVQLGVAATVDPTTLKVPGAWLALRSTRAVTLDGTVELSVLCYLVAGDYATPQVLDALGELHELVAPYAADDTVEAVTLALPNYAPAGLPALAVPMTVEVTPDPDATPAAGGDPV